MAKEKEVALPETPDPAKASTAPTGKRPRVVGRLAHPVYLIHHGKFEVEIPAETREIVVNDPEDENFGNVVVEEVVPAYKVKGDLPPGSRYGSRKVGVAHEVIDAAEAEDLKRKGFVTATDAEIKKSEKMGTSSLAVDRIAARDRERAAAKFASMPGNRAVTTADGEEK
jgi:hypothetical protein